MESLTKFTADPRHFQIFSLGILLSVQTFWGSFGPSLPIIGVTLASIIGIQLFFTWRQGYYDLRSPLITGLGLCMLLRASEWWMFPLAGILAIGSKFLLRYEGKHVFNPGNFAIAVLLLTLPRDIWVSTGQWGSEVWMGFMLASLGFLVLYRIPKADISLFFFACYGGLLFIRCLWLGDPMAIPFHQLQSGALLIFTFFMISDPKTTPDHRHGRFAFALAVALIAFTLQFGFQIREGLFYALALVSMATPMIDRFAPAPSYEWRKI